MQALIVKLLTAVRLTRVTMAFGAVADVWFVILVTRAGGPAEAEVARMPLALALAAGAVVACGLFAYGASLNDVLDVRHDSAFFPDRPIPAGRIRSGQAVVVAVGALIITVVAAASLGRLSLWLMLPVAAAILFYNAAGRFVPAVGVVTLGLIQAALMMIPNPRLAFTPPVWLIMTHAMALAAAIHLLEDKRPRLGRRGLAIIATAWLFWSAALFALGGFRGGLWPPGLPVRGFLWPALAIAGFVVVAVWKTTGVAQAAAADKLKRYGAVWQALYGAAWLAALDRRTEAAWLAAFAVVALLVMTGIREAARLAARPIVYR